MAFYKIFFKHFYNDCLNKYLDSLWSICRVDFSFNRLLAFFKTFLIDNKTSVEYIFGMFINVQNIYTRGLRASIEREIRAGFLKHTGNPIYYNYLILDGPKLHNILKCYNNNVFAPTDIKNKDVDSLRGSCLYAGKGKTNRKFQHAIDGKKIQEGELILTKFNEKFGKIITIWEQGNGIVILHLFTETTHYEAHAREYAIIKSLNINNITNIVNGTAYGAMKNTWNETAVINYGSMILYNALKMCINETPTIIKRKDVILTKERCKR